MNKNCPKRLSQFIIHSPSKTSRVFIASDIMESTLYSELRYPETGLYVSFLDWIHEAIERNIVHQSMIYPLYVKLEAETNASYIRNVQLGNFWNASPDEKIKLEANNFWIALKLIDELAESVKTISHPLTLIGMDFWLKKLKQISKGKEIQKIEEVWEKLEHAWRRCMNKNQMMVYDALRSFIKTERDYTQAYLSLLNPPVNIEKVLPRAGLYSTIKSANYLIESLRKNLVFMLEILENRQNIRSFYKKYHMGDAITILNNLNTIYNKYFEHFIYFPTDATVRAVNNKNLQIYLTKKPRVFFTSFFLVAKERSIDRLVPFKGLYEKPTRQYASLMVVRDPDKSKRILDYSIPETIKVGLLYTQCITASKFYFASGFMECPLIPKSGCPIKQTEDPTRILQCLNSEETDLFDIPAFGEFLQKVCESIILFFR